MPLEIHKFFLAMQGRTIRTGCAGSLFSDDAEYTSRFPAVRSASVAARGHSAGLLSNSRSDDSDDAVTTLAAWGGFQAR